MNDTQSMTESLLDIVRDVDRKAILLPEFQRDFRWEPDRIHDLFDSLIKDIFIGTVIYGKPTFGMALREIDTRPRRSKSKGGMPIVGYTDADIKRLVNTNNLRIVLDGQQRITSIYRAVVGIEDVYIHLRADLEVAKLGGMTLEQMLDEVSGDDRPDRISVKVADAYELHRQALEDEDLNAKFAASAYIAERGDELDGAARKAAERIYRVGVKSLRDLLNREKLVAYYLLDMGLDKFCAFFERSNSKAVQLNFTDILAAKLYTGFNLRKKIEAFEESSGLTLNREIIIRSIAHVSGRERSPQERPSIDKQTILNRLEPADFTRHWEPQCRAYSECLEYLLRQHYILSVDWMPSENMLLPMMEFRRHIGGFGRMNEHQRAFLEFWYWASVFSNRYSTSSNEVIMLDCAVMESFAKGEPVPERGYRNKLRLVITEPADLFGYTKKGVAVYKGVLNLIGYAAKGVHGWTSDHAVDLASSKLEDHHIFPRAYILGGPKLDMEPEEAEDAVDCVVNRALIPKLLNIQIGKRPPQAYLAEIAKINPRLGDCLARHAVPAGLAVDPSWNGRFQEFLEQRAAALYDLIMRYAANPPSQVSDWIDPPATAQGATGRARLKDLIASGKVRVGERVFCATQPSRLATIVDESTVEFEGKRLPINRWGVDMTGWQTINIYKSVFLERTRRPLGELR